MGRIIIKHFKTGTEDEETTSLNAILAAHEGYYLVAMEQGVANVRFESGNGMNNIPVVRVYLERLEVE
jgi:hypothetical protein